MAEGLATTFELLAKTGNEAAVGTLLVALDSCHASVREGALRSLLARVNVQGHREILRRLHLVDDSARRIIAQFAGRMTRAIRDSLLDDDPQVCLNAYRATVWLREYDLVPVLLSVLEDADNPNSALACRTLIQLVDLLHEDLTKPDLPEGRRDCHLFRHGVVSALEQSVGRFGRHKRREVLECFLLLAQRDNSVLKEILQTTYHPAFVMLIEILSTTLHGSILGLLLSYLDDPKPPSAVLSLVARRSDLKFVHYLLRKIGREPSAPVATNLKRISTVHWVRGDQKLLDQLDDADQHAAVRLVMASGIPRAEAFTAIEHLTLHGKRGGRRAATEALAEFQGANANALTLRALEDPDPYVQANILSQIRGRGIPGALPKLVAMIDSRHAVVRKAARKGLAEFSFKRFLAAFDMLDEEVRQTTGALVKKIDPQTLSLLQVELESAVRARRLRGLAMTLVMGCVEELEPRILALLQDDDHMVRVQAAATLSHCNSEAARAALREGLADRSPAVQDACLRSLQEQEAFAQWRASLTKPHP